MTSKKPAPPPETVRELTSPVWARKTTWTFILAVMAAAPTIANIWLPLFPPKVAAAIAATAGTLAAIAALYARQGGTNAAARALDKARREDP